MSGIVRILYIDDDPGLGRLLQKSMGGKGFDVQHVTTGAEGLERLSRERFDIIALDHNLTNETGLDVMARLAELPERPPVIYVTGSEDARTAVAALKAGAADYVWKDVQGHYRELLAESIHAALAQQRLRNKKDAAIRQLRESRDRAETLLGEVNHRVANSLALIASLARLQAGAVSDESARMALSEMQVRIRAIAGVHRRLYTSDNVHSVKFDEYLTGLVGELQVALDGANRYRIRVRTERCEVATDRVVSLGVLLTELITNACKYAYPDGQTGEIRIALERVEGDRLRLVIEDDGVGWRGEGSVKGTGLGSRIVSAMASTLQTQLNYEPVERGTRAAIEFAAT
ncbi:MAG: histidine kinase dimerization/phosphoacceptor domain -containing protein [Rhizomicrobium sp.]